MGPFQDGWTEQDVAAVIARGVPDELLYVPIVISMDPPDFEWSQAICISLASHWHRIRISMSGATPSWDSAISPVLAAASTRQPSFP